MISAQKTKQDKERMCGMRDNVVREDFQLCATPWTVAHQAPLSMGFSRQESWSGLPCPPPGDHPRPGTEPASLMSPALAGRFFTTRARGKLLCEEGTFGYSLDET